MEGYDDNTDNELDKRLIKRHIKNAKDQNEDQDSFELVYHVGMWVILFIDTFFQLLVVWVLRQKLRQISQVQKLDQVTIIGGSIISFATFDVQRFRLGVLLVNT